MQELIKIKHLIVIDITLVNDLLQLVFIIIILEIM